jgi:hypothetical protein
MRTFAIVFLGCFVLTPILLGQTPPAVDGRVSFMMVAGGEARPVRLMTVGDAPRVVGEVRLLPRIRSRELTYRGPSRLVLRPAAETEEVLTELTLPTDARRVLVFLVPKREAEGYRAHVMPEAESRTRPNELIIFNATPARLATRLAGQEFFVSPGAHPPLSTASMLQDNPRLTLAVETAEGWRVVTDGEVQFAAGMRSYLLILPPRRPGQLRVQVFAAHEPVSSQDHP